MNMNLSKAMLRPTLVFLVFVCLLILGYRAVSPLAPNLVFWIAIGLLAAFVGLPLLIWLGLMVLFMLFSQKSRNPGKGVDGMTSNETPTEDK